MTEEALRSLIETWQSRLGLASWRITVKFADDVDSGGHQCLMAITRSHYYERATLSVSRAMFAPHSLPDSIERDLLEAPNADVERIAEETVVHELLHCVLRDVMEAGDLVREDVHPTARQTWDGAWRHAEEATVEKLATALVAAFRDRG